jgi:hypothetical protein
MKVSSVCIFKYARSFSNKRVKYNFRIKFIRCIHRRMTHKIETKLDSTLCPVIFYWLVMKVPKEQRYEARCVIFCTGNLTVGKLSVHIFEFAIGM